MALELATGLDVFATRVVYLSDCPSSRELNTDLITMAFVYTGQTWLMPNMFHLVSQRKLRTFHANKGRPSPALADGLIDEAAHGATSLAYHKSRRRLLFVLDIQAIYDDILCCMERTYQSAIRELGLPGTATWRIPTEMLRNIVACSDTMSL
ncbi:hypothetical protein H634G_03552 [Metarhizium anisopliae BRIP 53293]|uniref:Uncharacterized protein n=1 Tax=Metarhizium anisopliae BRIP 53293 TaxID=1291518 RepID=A0A0D9P494_METAN|nr:hypothetical protein H634G_03552 [Metarhizium anisopliae BRIP 53293]KJK86735.1 hypothetical protein H633G_09391 [Metarhizium anisopliae BRIP 53284]